MNRLIFTSVLMLALFTDFEDHLKDHWVKRQPLNEIKVTSHLRPDWFSVSISKCPGKKKGRLQDYIDCREMFRKDI